MNEESIITWNLKSPDGLQSITIRTDDKLKAVDYANWAKGVIPSEREFPNDQGDVAHTDALANPAPKCAVHGNYMTLKPAGVSKAGRKYPAFWSCGQKNADSSWCSYKPPKEETV